MQLPELFTCLCSVLLLGRGAHGLHDSHPVFSFRSWFLQDLSQALPKETASQEPSRGSESWPWSHNQVKLRLTESQNDEAEAPGSTQVDQLSDYIGISKRAASSVNSDYLHSDYQRRSAKTSLKEIAKKHPVSAVFEAIENTQKLGSNCTESGYRSLAVPFPKVTHKPFKYLTVSALKTANVLNNLFRTWDASPTLYNDAFFFAQVRSTLETDRDELIHGAAIAFEVGQYQGQNGEKHFCPYIYRAKNGALYSENVSNRQYAAKEAVGYDWFHDQRGQHFSNLVGHEAGICRSVSDSDPARRHNLSTVVTTDEQGLWRGPFYKCKGDKAWTLTYSVPFFGCTKNKTLQFKGAVKLDFDLSKWHVNQCDRRDGDADTEDEAESFAGTHKCRPSTECYFVNGGGFRRGSYICECKRGFYMNKLSGNLKFYNGSFVEQTFMDKLLNNATFYDKHFECLPCATGCSNCSSDVSCFADYSVMLRGVVLGVIIFCLVVCMGLIVIVIRLRRTKVMKTSMWALLEIILLGAMLLYATLVIQYFKSTNLTCILLPWFREVGFAIVYGSLILKIYRVLAEFQSRKAHRVMVRDSDMLKYLSVIVFVVVAYMAAWTAVSVDHLGEGNTMLDQGIIDKKVSYTICKSREWDYIIETGEFLFLCAGIYLCYCIRTAPSDYQETRYISLAICIETMLSLLLHIVRHFVWLHLHPDYIYLMYFIRCQITVTGTLILVLGPKIFYALRPPDSDCFRNRAYSTSDAHDNALPESMKLHVNVSANGDVDLGELNLADMDPEVIKEEFKRLYSELQICKTKTMRKDNPHISKRRGGRKQTHRRFSLQALHHKHRHHHNSDDHDHEMSKTPEESTNSAEGIAISMCEESSIGEVRTPTVTFKPGHKSIC